MSTHVYWRPNHKGEKSLGQCGGWRDAFGRKFGYPCVVEEGSTEHAWLCAMSDIDKDGATEAVQAIEQHGSIILDARS